MLKQVMLFLAVAAASVVSAVEPVWKNPEVNQQNREPRRANYFAYESRALAEKGDKAASSRYLSMEGMWKFNFVKNYPDPLTSVRQTTIPALIAVYSPCRQTGRAQMFTST